VVEEGVVCLVDDGYYGYFLVEVEGVRVDLLNVCGGYVSIVV